VGELRGFGAELAVEPGGGFEPVSPAERACQVGGVEAVFEGDQGDALGGELLAQIGEVAEGARELAQGEDEDALDGVRSDESEQAAEAFSRGSRPRGLVGTLKDDFPAFPGRVGGEAGEDLFHRLAFGGGSGVEGNFHGVLLRLLRRAGAGFGLQ